MKKIAHIETWKQLGKKSSVQNSKSPTSFREISQSREKRLGMVQGRMGDRLQKKVKGSNKLFYELLKSRSPSPANKLSLTKNSQMSTLECSTSFHNNQSKCDGLVTGLQFRGLKQRINHTYKRKEPQKADSKNSSQPHKQKYKYVTQKSIIRHKSKENIFPTQLDCRPSEIEESVIRSREGKLLFDMSPTL